MYQGVTYSQHPKSELAWFSDDSLLFHFQTVHYSNNVFECLKAEQVQGQMRQNVQILDIIVRFELLRPKPNNFVWILDINHLDFGKLGPKISGLGPNCQQPNVPILDRFLGNFKA